MKFSTQFHLNKISVEFGDEPDPITHCWVIAKILIFSIGFPIENVFFFRIIHNIYQSTQFLTLILNLILIFKKNRSFPTKHWLKRSQNTQKLHLETKMPRYVSDDQQFGSFWNAWFCSESKWLSKRKTPNSIALLSMICYKKNCISLFTFY